MDTSYVQPELERLNCGITIRNDLADPPTFTKLSTTAVSVDHVSGSCRDQSRTYEVSQHDLTCAILQHLGLHTLVITDAIAAIGYRRSPPKLSKHAEQIDPSTSGSMKTSFDQSSGRLHSAGTVGTSDGALSPALFDHHIYLVLATSTAGLPLNSLVIRWCESHFFEST
ncbi:hypothetical protein BJ508DRAFT_98735 [Ascobolus immersus RN42]|uniref:Uncharacterized protein n=1 Tax=Ascobolus immersus RN42 TaxID=1160509 RepID=A0A3N4IN62_ASCIM|nr:hypothetical protein BJ508DRAFT_98735 [Ascobolus immersus RN42]